MSSDSLVPVPRTGVPIGIQDPVEEARAELKAALAAIELKGNIPRRVARATDKKVAQVRSFYRREPALATAAIVAGAALVGAAVWGVVRLYIR
ncbi:MAG: hypothetical protein ABW024_02640 [Microbacterium sp.]